MAGTTVDLTDETFETEVLQSTLPVLVDFWAQRCQPCLRLAPVLQDLASEYSGRVRIAKVDVDQHQQYAIQYGITSIPALLFFHQGQLVDRIVGAVPREQIARKLDGLIH